MRMSMRSLLVALHTTCLIAVASAETQRSLTIEDVLRMENLGRAEIVSNGRLVVYEWIAPYEKAPNLQAASPTVFGPMSKLYAADLSRSATPRPLFEQDPHGGYWIGAPAPDATKIAVYSLVSGELKAGVYDLASQHVTWFGFRPNYFWNTQQPVWISNDELLYPALLPGEFPSGFLRPAVAKHYNERWQKAFNGREPSATVLESNASGIEQAEAYRPGKLMRVNVRTGETTVLDEGYFYKLRLSPDRRYLAALRQGGMIQPTRSRHSIGAHHQLVVYELSPSARRLIPCEDCSLSAGGLLQWSADGKRLAFSARSLHGNIESEEFLQYWPATRALKRIPNSGLLSSCGVSPIPVGDGEAVAVFSLPLAQQEEVSSSAPCPTQDGTRWDWFLIDAEGRLSNLTASFKSVSADFIRSNAPLGIADDALFISADDNVWRLDVSGGRRRLTTRLPSAPEPWTLGFPGSGVTSEEVMFTGSPVPTARAVLQTTDEVLVLDLKSGTSKRTRRPGGDTKLLAVTNTASTAVFRADSRNGTQLLVADGRAPARTLLTINGDLSEIAEAARVQISYQFENAHLSSCALLPPDFRPDRRYPLIVHLYPFSRPTSSCGSNRVDEFSAYNFQLLAAQGYIVLFAANPARLIQTPESPLGGLAPVILAAVDQAVREGYADPDRIGIFGFSQGHHAVLQLLTQTGRFKAAVVANGVSNATSHYGSMPLYTRMLPEIFSFGNPDRYELNAGPNGLGAMPWEDPLRYVQNSPTLHANRIQTPLLIMHSDLDQFPLGQSEELFSALYRLRKEATYVTYWGESHGNMSPANIRDMWQRMFRWYEKYLKISLSVAGAEPPSRDHRSTELRPTS